MGAVPMKLRPGVTVVVSSFPARAAMLARAVASIAHQTMPPEAIIVAMDVQREGG